MKPNELMVGDIILKDGQPVRVLEIYGGEVADCYAPLPITPEILEANGFESRELNHFTLYQFGKESFSIAYDLLLKNLCAFTKTVNTGCRMCTTPDKSELSIQIQYVHELQQAMRLIGLRDLADNFVIKKGGQQ